MLHVGTLAEEAKDLMSLARMRELFIEILDERRSKWLTGLNGEKVPVSAEALSATEVVEQENGRPVGVRPVYELRFCAFRINQRAALQHGAARFRSDLLAQLGMIHKQLENYQPGLEWTLVAALVDPQRDNITQPKMMDQYEPTPEEVQIRMATEPVRPGPREDAVFRYSRVTSGSILAEEWRWNVSTVWCDVSGGADFSDPVERLGGVNGNLKKYAETRQLRHLPRGTRRNREKSIELLKRLGAMPLQVAPASQLTQEQRITAMHLVANGTNVALVAKLLGLQPEALMAELPMTVGATETPVRRRRVAVARVPESEPEAT